MVSNIAILQEAFKILMGVTVVFLVLLLFFYGSWWNATIYLLQGSIALLLLGVGAGLAFWGITALKEELDVQ